MCGRFITTGTWDEYQKYLSILPPEIEKRNGPIPNYNVAITSEQEVIARDADGEVTIEKAVWDFVPEWMKDTSKKTGAIFNAKGEGAANKPFYRTALNSSRCLIPATGYYEFTGSSGSKQPWLVHLPEEGSRFEPFAFAGLVAPNPHSDTITFVIFTLPAHEKVAHLKKRMPVILRPEAVAAWLDSATGKDEAVELMQENRAADLEFYAVSKAVGNVKNKGAELIERA